MKDNRIKTWELERYLLGELSTGRIKEIDKLVQEDLKLKKEIERLKQSNQSILGQYSTESVVPQILRRYKGETEQKKVKKATKPFALKRLIYVTPVLAAALIMLFVMIHNNGDIPMDT